MKSAKWMLPVTLVLLSGLMAAQSLTNSRVVAQPATFKAYVLFRFVVGSQTLPAGSYQIQRLMGRPSEAGQVGMIIMRSSDPRVYKAVVTKLVEQSLDSPYKARLVFTRHAKQYYLSEFRMEGEKGHEIPNVSPESELFGFDASREEIVLAELH